MSDLLKEAIADAKAVRETALENAKAALEEAFTPQLKNMLSAKLREDDDSGEDMEDMEDEEDEEMPSDEVPVDDMPVDDMPSDDEEEMEDEEEAEETYHEDADMEEALGAGGGALGGMLAAEMGANPLVAVPVGAMAGDFIQDTLQDEGHYNESVETSDLDSVIAELEEEIDADNQNQELYAESTDEYLPEEEVYEEEEPVYEDEQFEEEYEIDESDELEEDEELTAEDIENLYSIANNSMNELAEYKEAVYFLKDKLHEVNILNAKLLYTNKLFKEYSLDNNQKLKVVENFDRAQTTREIKLVFSTIAEQLNENSGIPKRKPIKESASAPVSSTKPASKESTKVITEETDVANRFRKLAGLIKG
jgi:hypothetical protein